MISFQIYQRKITEQAVSAKISPSSVILSAICGRFNNQVGIWAVAENKIQAQEYWEEAYKPDNGLRLDYWVFDGIRWIKWEPQDDESLIIL